MSTSFVGLVGSGGEGTASVSGIQRVVLGEGALKLNWRVSGPPDAALSLVCLHAVGHDQDDYAGLHGLTGARVLSFDWPGHGGSGADQVAASAERYAAVCHALLSTLDGAGGKRRYVLVGNSIGGAVALRLATRSPLADQVAGVVLLDAGGLMPMGAKERAFCHVFAWAYRAASRGGIARRALPGWYSKLYQRLLVGPQAAARREAIVAAGLERAPALSEAWQSFAAPEATVIPHCAELRVPTLVCWARSDPFNGLSASLPAIRSIPEHRLEVFEGGHAPHVEQPERFREVLLEYLDGIR